MSIEVFFSYSHRDEDARNELEKHLALLKRDQVITSWHDRRIAAGMKWADEIDHHLTTAHVILLLISADFLASDYCYGIEMKKALERDAKGEACVIPIILHACDWYSAPFSELQCLPTGARPISSWRNRREAFADVAKGIRNAVQQITAKTPVASTISGRFERMAGVKSGSTLQTAQLHESAGINNALPIPLEKPASKNSVCHVVDDVDITYSDQTRSYHVVFRKVLRNLSARPRDHLYARIDVCVTPADLELARAYYHDNPISLEGISFRAMDGLDHNLDVHILHQYPSNIEMHLRFRDQSTGEFFPIYENQEIEVRYECDISDRQWGTYLRRHVRVQTDYLAVRFSFPKDLVRVWGNEEVGDDVVALTRNLEKTTVDGNDVYTWSTSSPDPDSIVIFHWAFRDGREKALYEELKRRYGKPSSAV